MVLVVLTTGQGGRRLSAVRGLLLTALTYGCLMPVQFTTTTAAAATCCHHLFYRELLYLAAIFFQGGAGGGITGFVNNMRQWLWIPVSQDAYRCVWVCGGERAGAEVHMALQGVSHTGTLGGVPLSPCKPGNCRTPCCAH